MKQVEKKEKIIGNRQKRNFRSDSFPFGWIPFRPVSIAPALRIPDLVFYGMSKAKWRYGIVNVFTWHYLKFNYNTVTHYLAFILKYKNNFSLIASCLTILTHFELMFFFQYLVFLQLFGHPIWIVYLTNYLSYKLF